MKSKVLNTEEEIETPHKVMVFLLEYELLCRKYNMSICIKDDKPVIENYNHENVEKVKNSYINIYKTDKNE